MWQVKNGGGLEMTCRDFEVSELRRSVAAHYKVRLKDVEILSAPSTTEVRLRTGKEAPILVASWNAHKD